MVTSFGEPVRVAIGIPTFRRPQRLLQLLESLLPSLEAEPADLIVADNDCDPAIRELVLDFRRRWPRIDYLAVADRGISANRNAIIEAFLALPGSPDWLAMLDDDLVTPPRWLPLMLGTAEATRADAVAGPYAMEGTTGNAIVDASALAQPVRRPTGPSEPFFSAGNILLSRAMLVQTPLLRFDNRFGLSGGEDYDFFGQLAARGGTFAWCQEARCIEEVDSARLTTRAVLFRYFSSGNYMATIDRIRGRDTGLAKRLTFLAKALGLMGVGTLTLDHRRAIEGLLRAYIGIGALSSRLGKRFYRYR